MSVVRVLTIDSGSPNTSAMFVVGGNLTLYGVALRDIQTSSQKAAISTSGDSLITVVNLDVPSPTTLCELAEDAVLCAKADAKPTVTFNSRCAKDWAKETRQKAKGLCDISSDVLNSLLNSTDQEIAQFELESVEGTDITKHCPILSSQQLAVLCIIFATVVSLILIAWEKQKHR